MTNKCIALILISLFCACSSFAMKRARSLEPAGGIDLPNNDFFSSNDASRELLRIVCLGIGPNLRLYLEENQALSEQYLSYTTKGKSPLHVALELGLFEMAEILLEFHPELAFMNKSNEQANIVNKFINGRELIFAIGTFKEDLIKEALNKPIPVLTGYNTDLLFHIFKCAIKNSPTQCQQMLRKLHNLLPLEVSCSAAKSFIFAILVYLRENPGSKIDIKRCPFENNEDIDAFIAVVFAGFLDLFKHFAAPEGGFDITFTNGSELGLGHYLSSECLWSFPAALMENRSLSRLQLEHSVGQLLSMHIPNIIATNQTIDELFLDSDFTNLEAIWVAIKQWQFALTNNINLRKIELRYYVDYSGDYSTLDLALYLSEPIRDLLLSLADNKTLTHFNIYLFDIVADGYLNDYCAQEIPLQLSCIKNVMQKNFTLQSIEINDERGFSNNYESPFRFHQFSSSQEDIKDYLNEECYSIFCFINERLRQNMKYKEHYEMFMKSRLLLLASEEFRLPKELIVYVFASICPESYKNNRD